MPLSRWPIYAIVLAGALATGSCAGALAGHYTVTGGLYPNAGWDVPSFGTEDTLAHLPAVASVERTVPTPQYVGYYPAQVPTATSPQTADAASRDYAALYDEPAFEPAHYSRSEPVADDWPPAPSASADVEAYSERETGTAEPLEAGS